MCPMAQEWTPPSCSFSDCPYPAELPEGYARDPQGRFDLCPAFALGHPLSYVAIDFSILPGSVHCAEGYIGPMCVACS